MVGLEQRIACNFQGASLFLSDYFPLLRSCAFLRPFRRIPPFISPTLLSHAPLTCFSYLSVLMYWIATLPASVSRTPDLATVPQCNDSLVRVCKCASTNVRARLHLIISRSDRNCRSCARLPRHNGPSDDPGIPGTPSGAFSGEKNRHSPFSFVPRNDTMLWIRIRQTMLNALDIFGYKNTSFCFLYRYCNKKFY